MEDARRFLRYVMPGLVFIIEISLYLLISDRCEFVKLMQKYGKGIAFPISVVLASGGLGFIFGVIYFSVYKCMSKSKKLSRCVVNHFPQIKDVVNRGWLKLIERADGKEIDVQKITPSGAWRIQAALWHERKESSEIIKSANSLTDRLGDIMHGLGTAFTGSIIAIIVWIFIHFLLLNHYSSRWYYFVPLVMLFMLLCHLSNYRSAKKDFQSVVDIIMTDVLREEYLEKQNNPVILNVSTSDYK